MLSSEVPMEPPSCWPVLTVAEATPASRGATPYVPVLNAVENISPSPRPVTSRAGRTVPAYPECTPILVNKTMPSAASTRPAETIGLGPIRGIITMLERFDDSAMHATIGRNATPVITGE